MGKVIHLDSTGNGGGTGKGFLFEAVNYADLLTKVGMVEGDLAIVYNSQGVWLVNRKLKGVYIYQSGVWEYANEELQTRLAAKLDSVVGGTNISIDNTDPLNPIINYTGSGGSSGYEFYAPDFDSPVNADYPIQEPAPALSDPDNNALTNRVFDSVSEQGISFRIKVPAGATNITIFDKSRAQTAPVGASSVKRNWRVRELTTTTGAWGSAIELDTVAIATNTNWVDTTQTETLATLGLSAGGYFKILYTRDAGDVGDTLSGINWLLNNLDISYS